MELPERFWRKVVMGPNGCWLWVAGMHYKGYGVFHWDRKDRKAHRVSYEAVHGPIPEGLQIDHLCRTRRCVNPDHLEPVTSQENQRRGLRNQFTQWTCCARGHAYTESNTYHTSAGARSCRTCHKENQRDYVARRAARA